MTPAEMSDLAALRLSVEEGFREIRGVMEQNRRDDHSAHTAIYTKIDEHKTELMDDLQEVRDQQVAASAVRRWVAGAAVGLAAWLAVLVAAAGLVIHKG